ncbi:7TM diverse intracellular signaling domain-containing protein [Hymenobacter negativus]|uniref:histidine kinase n=1 Tax=Hymenobacter negativus TaxID=2795026 RepID=A0ABS3QNR6_9BACT|nr:7TM diverse intracellular signaling domain-containing protein [Hymenobacter negativus]MBO2012325.1 response regulator [Hymenobacter negativus]
MTNRTTWFGGRWRGWLLVLLALAKMHGVAAQAPLFLRDTAQDYTLGRHWDVLAVPTSEPDNLTLAQVRAPEWAARFRRSQQDAPNERGGNGEVWLRTTVVNAATPHTTWILRNKLSSTNKITAYVVGPDGNVQELAMGPASLAAQNQAVPYRCYHRVLPLPMGQPVTVYLQTRGGIIDYSLCEQHTLQRLSYWENLGLALFLGTMLMLGLYNLFLFISIREVAYLYYVAYVLAFCGLHMQSKGLFFWWFYPALSTANNELLLLVLTTAATLFGALMARSFLDTKRLVPRLDWLLVASAVAAPLPLVARYLLPDGIFSFIYQFMPFFTGLVMLTVGIAVMRTGYRPARYYMAGWGLVILAVFVYSLTRMNVLPANGWTMNGTGLAWVLEMAFLSFGLASRFNLARAAEQEAQSRALATLREKEEVQQTANRQLTRRAAELEKAYAELRDSLATSEQLKSLDELKTNFFTNISHEFRTPLTLILGPAEDLAIDNPDPTTRRSGSLILRNAQRLLRLVNQLLDLSKLEAGAMELLPTAGDAASLARQQAATFASLAEAQGVQFRTEGPVRLPLVFDAPKLETILSNLLTNALRFTPNGGEVVLGWRVVPATAAEPAAVEFMVRDTGPGIAASQLPQLFNRFYQGASPSVPGAQPGTGVGLTLVKELTELHGGTVAVSSPPGQGATFTVRLPMDLVPVNGAPSAETDASRLASTALSSEMMAFTPSLDDYPEPVAEADVVLFVEDNEDVREFVRSSLAPAGYRLLEAPDGLRGVELALEHVPDLIVSDVMMPGLDGYGVVRQLKSHSATSHVPIVLLTAKSAGTDRLEGLETGADAYLGKPFSARELRAQVRNLLALRDRNRTFTLVTPQAALTEAQSTQLPPLPDNDQPSAPARLSSIDRNFLEKVISTVEENLGDSDFDVDHLSRAVALSRTQVHRKLRALTGQAPAEYIRTTRLQRALELLRERVGTVSEISYQVGFGSPAHFSTVFSRHFGYPPSEVARQ